MTSAVRSEHLGLAAGAVARPGRDYCRALADITDEWVAAIFDEAVVQTARPSGRVALLAIGGYGRGELAPQSDLDLLLVHDVKSKKVAREVEPIASAIWYPLWDSGVKLGHAVRRIDEQLDLAKTDLDSATALVSARPLAGDDELTAQVIALGLDSWRSHRTKHLAELRDRVRVRQESAGDVAYRLEPDLKDGHGGLRDVQSLWWAQEAGLELIAEDLIDLDRSYDVLLRARVALHLATDRAGDVLRLEDQDAAAAAGGWRDADELMADVAAAGRTIAWLCDENWGRAVAPVASEPDRAVAPGVILRGGEIELAPDADPGSDATLVLQTAVAAARHRCRIGRATLDRLHDDVGGWPGNWPVGATDDLIALLLEGHQAIPVLESLDQRDLVARLLPEWAPVRSRPQRNAYHRFTVDRHLWEAAANAADLAHRVSRPDLLVLGALFHDLGKGYPGDHTVVGMDLIRTVGPKLGLVPADVEILVTMVEQHLLLPDVAMRRDLTDPATIEQVATAVGTVDVLDLLHALTEADSLATGPSAWGDWKEGLVNELAARVRHVLGGGDVAEVTWRLFPDAETLAVMAAGELDISRVGDVITVVSPDASGTFSRVAGVLSLHGLDVVTAQAHSDEGGMAASQFRIVVPDGGINWRAVKGDLVRSLEHRLAIEARLAERAATYRRRRRTQAAAPGPPSVVFDDAASSNATVIVVRAVTKIGILHRISKALGELGLDIRHATVQTIGMEVVDTFYVRADGKLVTEAAYRKEIHRALLHAVT
ncbi:MAG TPA: [protein-PII] uridylyltransferase [Ilumatobacteraceae bacterium]|nr:[protein-PII] uridylyltransferase [Ilumatobacteraceae bacterium]